MTVPASARGLGGGLPSELERETANQLRRLLAQQQEAGDLNIKVTNERHESADITLTPGMSNLLRELLRHVGRGDAVTLVPVNKMLTTQQAADILNVSRPFLIGLLDREEIPFALVGRHRRIQAEHLFAYKDARARRRGQALDALAALDGETL